MKQYLNALEHVLSSGEVREDRTGVGTISTFGIQMRFNLREGFPAVTVKKLAWKSVVSELLWFLEGSTDERRLAEILHGTRDVKNKTIWTANADNQGKNLGYKNTDNEKLLGPVYGHQWRMWTNEDFECGYVQRDQISNVIKSLKEDPFGRRHIVSAWNVADLEYMALPPCHVMFQFYVSNDRKLSCHMYQRSMDMALGIPFNIASYALLTHIIALETGLDVGDLIISGGDAHIYLDHIEGVKEMLSRTPYDLPKLKMPKKPKGIDNYTMSDFELLDYNYHPTIKMPMAV